MKAPLTVLALLIFSTPTAFAQNRYDLYQQALRMERVDGDLEGAVVIYEQIVDKFGSDRSLTARALLQLGRSYTRLGREEDARRAFEKLRGRYPKEELQSAMSAIDDMPPPADRASGIVLRRLETEGGDFEAITGAPTGDGRYLFGVDWETGDLAVNDIRTGAVRRLTNKGTWRESRAFAMYPRPSPDDQRVAYLWYNDEEEPELRILDLDTAHERVVYHYPSEVLWLEPAGWTPDGRNIVTLVFTSEGTYQLVRIDIENGDRTVLKTLDWRYPFNMSVSPDGRFVAYDVPSVDGKSGRDVMLIETDGSGEFAATHHPANDWMAEWTPAGDGLVFLSDRSGTRDLWFVVVGEGRGDERPRRVKSDVGLIFPLGFTESDAFFFGRQVGGQDVYTVAPDDRGDFGSPALLSERFVGRNGLPEWSPDGSKVAFVTRRTFVPTPGSRSIVVLDTASGREHVVPTVFTYLYGAMSWSPDGRYLAFVGFTAKGDRDIVRLDVETGEVNTMVRHQLPSYLRDVQYDPHGSVYFIRTDPTAGLSAIVQHELEGGEETVVYERRDGATLRHLAISPADGRLAFVLDAQGRPPRLMVLARGNEASELTSADHLGDPTWSSNGREIYFLDDRGRSAGFRPTAAPFEPSTSVSMTS